MKKSLSLCIVLCLLIGILLSGCSNNGEKSEGKENGKNLKVAFLYDSPVGDGGWITSHDLGRKAVEEMDGVDTTYVDNISESDGWSYMNNFAKENYDLIFACSFGYMQDCVDVSEKNPDTVFMHCAGYMTTDNMGNYFGKNFEASYLAGMACAGVSESGIIGYVGPFPIAEVIRNVNAFALGVKAVNPEAVVKVVWINAWYDPTLASEAAESLISSGADALAHYENSPAVVQTAEKHGVYAVGQHSDAKSYAEDYCLTSTIWNWEKLYTSVVEEVKAGTWKPEAVWWGMKEGLVDIAELNPAIPDEVADKIQDVRQRLKDGDPKAAPYYGEVKDQSGKVRIADGVDATYDELMNMDYLVDNIDGEITAKE